MNFAFITGTAAPQRVREREALTHALPVNLGLQPIKLLALEPFLSSNTNAAPIPSNSKSAYSLGVMLSLTLAALMSTFRTLSPQSSIFYWERTRQSVPRRLQNPHGNSFCLRCRFDTFPKPGCHFCSDPLSIFRIDEYDEF